MACFTVLNVVAAAVALHELGCAVLLLLPEEERFHLFLYSGSELQAELVTLSGEGAYLLAEVLNLLLQCINGG